MNQSSEELPPNNDEAINETLRELSEAKRHLDQWEGILTYRRQVSEEVLKDISDAIKALNQAYSAFQIDH